MEKTQVRENGKPKAEMKRLRGLQRLDDRELQDLISMRAYELYLERGCEDGHDCEDWLQAERELLTEIEGSVTGPMRTSLPTSDKPLEAKVS